MYCYIAWRKRAVETMRRTAANPQLCNSCNVVSHARGWWVVQILHICAPLLGGSGTLVIQCHTAQGHWTVELIHCNALPSWSSGQCNCCTAMCYCLGAVGSATPAIHYLTALRQWVVQFLQCPTIPAGAGRQWTSCNAWADQLEAGELGPRSGRYLKAELLRCTGTLPCGSAQCNFCSALPYIPGPRGSATGALHCSSASGQWALELLSCTTTLARGNGQWNSYSALPHCRGAVGSATLAMHCIQCLGAVGSATPAIHCPHGCGTPALGRHTTKG